MTPHISHRLKRAAEHYHALNDKAPEELRHDIAAALQKAIAGKGVMAGERLKHVVARLCPEVHDVAARYGFKLRLGLPENTLEGLCKGLVFFVLAPVPIRLN